MSTVISPSLVKIGLKTKKFYHYAKFCRDPFLNCNYSSIMIYQSRYSSTRQSMENPGINSCYWPSVLHLQKPWKFNLYSSLVIFVLPVCFWIHMRGQEKSFSLNMYELENRNNWLIDLHVGENLTRTSEYFAVICNASTGYTSVNLVSLC